MILFGLTKITSYLYVTIKNTIMKQTTLTIAEAERQIEELQRHIKSMLHDTEHRLVESIKKINLPLAIRGMEVKWEKVIEECSDSVDVFYIKLQLPIANIEWTFEVFEWVMKYVNENRDFNDINAYPYHQPENKENKMYIKVNIRKA